MRTYHFLFCILFGNKPGGVVYISYYNKVHCKFITNYSANSFPDSFLPQSYIGDPHVLSILEYIYMWHTCKSQDALMDHKLTLWKERIRRRVCMCGSQGHCVIHKCTAILEHLSLQFLTPLYKSATLPLQYHSLPCHPQPTHLLKF